MIEIRDTIGNGVTIEIIDETVPSIKAQSKSLACASAGKAVFVETNAAISAALVSTIIYPIADAIYIRNGEDYCRIK